MVKKEKVSNTAMANVPTGDSQLTRRLRNISYMVWSIVGMMVIILLSVAIFRGGTWVENLNITDASQTPDQAQQPPGPTKQQLDCVSDKLGKKRFDALQQGSQPKPEESTAIQECLQS